MNATATVNTTDTVPPTPQPQKMTPEKLRKLMDANNLTSGALAELLGVHRNTVSRWLTYTADADGKTVTGTPIDAANALLILTNLQPKKRKK